MEEYRKLIDPVDAWYRSVQAKFPAEVPCTKGCRDCCIGIFDISLADRDLLREGLVKADPLMRKDIEGRAGEIMDLLREKYPELGDTLDGFDAAEIDDVCDTAGDVECPVLGTAGECRLYENRPLICRLAGLPVVDRSGDVIYPDGCSKCTLKTSQAPPLDFAGLRNRERKLLKKRYPEQAGVTLLIPQALEP